MKGKRLVVGAVSALGLTLAATGTQAGFTGIFDWTVSSCTGTNCSSIFLGYTVTDRDLSTIRWEANVFARAGECLRLQVISVFGATGGGTIDDEMVVVGPSGTVWRNDDFSGLLPRVAFVAPVTGWHSVTIARFDGAPTPRHDVYKLIFDLTDGMSWPMSFQAALLSSMA